MRSPKLCKFLSFVSSFFPISEPLLVSSVLRWQWYVWMRGCLLCWALSAPSLLGNNLELSHWWFLPFHFPHSFFLGTPKIQMMNLMECSYQFLIFLSYFPSLLLCVLGEFSILSSHYSTEFFNIVKIFITLTLLLFFEYSFLIASYFVSVSQWFLISEAINGSFVSVFFFLRNLCLL